jgi:hypothetical protein
MKKLTRDRVVPIISARGTLILLRPPHAGRPVRHSIGVCGIAFLESRAFCETGLLLKEPVERSPLNQQCRHSFHEDRCHCQSVCSLAQTYPATLHNVKRILAITPKTLARL